jgi:light-regulated signal transduction histidine kinase (bacteriophytochrome)
VARLNGELQRSVEELTAVNRELEAFSYSVSHDLRAPLRHINGFVDLLQKRAGAALDETARRHLATIAGAARQMGQLIDDLLSFSRMSRSELLRTRVGLGSLLAEVRAGLGPETRGRDVAWKVNGLPEVAGDPAMLRVVLTNLVSNALKYSRTRDRAEVEVGWQPGEEGEAIVWVRDNGVGFDMQYAGKLFGVFQRLHHATEFEGTGIGLATVRRIVHRHGGRTWAEGALDAGATVYFSLPLYQEGTR